IDANGPRGASWGPDDTIVFATINRSSGLMAVSAGGGQPIQLTTPNRGQGEENHWWPEFLPGGRGILFTVTSGPIGNSAIAVFDRRANTQRILVHGGSDAHYVNSGHLIYAAAGTLRAVAFDLDRLEVRGSPVPVLDPILNTFVGAAD